MIAYLKKFNKLDREISRNIDHIEKLQDRASRITPSYNPKVRGSSTIYSKTEDTLIEKIDLERELMHDLDLYITWRQELSQLFDQVDDGRHRLLLEYRYIDGLTFEKIADKLDCTLRNIHRLHQETLKELLPIWTAAKAANQ